MTIMMTMIVDDANGSVVLGFGFAGQVGSIPLLLLLLLLLGIHIVK